MGWPWNKYSFIAFWWGNSCRAGYRNFRMGPITCCQTCIASHPNTETYFVIFFVLLIARGEQYEGNWPETMVFHVFTSKNDQASWLSRYSIGGPKWWLFTFVCGGSHWAGAPRKTIPTLVFKVWSRPAQAVNTGLWKIVIYGGTTTATLVGDDVKQQWLV